MPEKIKGRDLAYEVLLELEKNGGKADALLRGTADKQTAADPRELAFFRRLSEGVIERQITLDYVIDLFASTKTAKMKRPVRILLRMGVYQILYMDTVPDRAAVDETVKLAVRKGLSGLRGFINGVLRSVAAGRAEIRYPDREKDAAAFLSVAYSMPEWITKRFLEQYSYDRTERILAACLTDRPLSVCLTKAADEEKLTALWKAQGVTAEQSPYTDRNFYLKGTQGVGRLAGYAEGAFFVQDVSATLAVCCAGIRRNDTVVDVCAAPGGKSIRAAEAAGSGGCVYAFDLTERKTALIRENAGRLHLPQIKAGEQDARVLREELRECADVVIADLPCSGLGVLGRKSDIRYRVRPEDILSLQTLQRQILHTAVGYLKPGGVLLYSTCTVSPEENDENRKWLAEQEGLSPESITEYLPEVLQGDTTDQGFLQIVSGEPEGMPVLDGFYIARFRKER